LRTYRRWVKGGEIKKDQRADAVRPVPFNKLSAEEESAILELCNKAEYASLPPSQIVPELLDKNVYLASESSFYRVLHKHGQLYRRGRSQPPQNRAQPTTYVASKANEVWSWDITYCASQVKGQFYYLYMFMDLYSRKIVGYEVHEKECGELAAELIQRCKLREQCFNQSLVLHSDNGAPMKAVTMKAKLEELGITPSHSRPRVSNDNPFSEALFKTLKYRPNWPTSGFKSLPEVRDWADSFVDWYNHKHKHSKLNFVTPAERHRGEDQKILAARKLILETAKSVNPCRWSGKVRDCKPKGPTTLNPDRRKAEIELEKAA
jgi:putative transposase